jgi:hypothetical protein
MRKQRQWISTSHNRLEATFVLLASCFFFPFFFHVLVLFIFSRALLLQEL